tara:strand:- start:6119 stop:6877 length:759 start_codon:yes stop_codon:yes gene_type:complete
MDKRNSMKRKRPMNQTVKKRIFKESLAKLSNDEIISKTVDLHEIEDIEEKSAGQLIPKIIKDLSSFEKAINRNKNGGYIIFGDAHHGDLAFDLIIKLYPNLNEKLQHILKNAYYFCEGENQLKEIKNIGYGKKHINLDRKPINISNYDELKRNHHANTEWPNIIMKNRHNGLHIISIGRSHLYSIKGKKDDSKIETVISFQDTLKKRTKRPITTFTINNDFELNYDDYKEYSAKHQLDDVTNNPKIRSLFAI